MPKVMLTPVLVGGYLGDMSAPVFAAQQAQCRARVEGELRGVLALNKDGKSTLLSRIAVEVDDEAIARLVGGQPIAGVEADVTVGWDKQSRGARLVSGWVRAVFETNPPPTHERDLALEEWESADEATLRDEQERRRALDDARAVTLIPQVEPGHVIEENRLGLTGHVRLDPTRGAT